MIIKHETDDISRADGFTQHAVPPIDLPVLENLKKVQTPNSRLDKFYLAENYHQKYRLQSQRSLMKEFNSIYPNFEDFDNSTAAARLNGLTSGFGSQELFQQEVESYGFPEELTNFIRV